MNSRTINNISELARRMHNARYNQGQGRMANIELNLQMLKMMHGNHAVNRVYNRAIKYMRQANEAKNRRKVASIKKAKHLFKMGPKIKAARKTMNYMHPNMLNEIMKHVRKPNN
jgi:hypothetical protein